MKKTGINTLIGLAVAVNLYFGNLYAQSQIDLNQVLNEKQRGIIAISVCTARADLPGLGEALNHGLDSGLTVNEIKEVLIHLYAYTGFPRSLNGLSTFQSVLEQREQKGIVDEIGREASPLPADKTSEELGSEVLVQLIGTSEPRGVRQFAPVVDKFLKAHLFGDIFGRDVLSFQSREIATISALSVMKGTESQLDSHLRVARNVGFTDDQLKAIAFEIAVQEGEQEADKESSVAQDSPQDVQVIRKGSQPSRTAPAEHFTGEVRIDSPFRASDPSRVYGASVTFQPGARTAWHSHPLGQVLIVTEGSGLVQRWGAPVEEIRPGDVVVIPPDQKHWHGAGPDTAMTHFAVAEQIEGRSTEWLEKVSDEEYASPPVERDGNRSE